MTPRFVLLIDTRFIVIPTKAQRYFSGELKAVGLQLLTSERQVNDSEKALVPYAELTFVRRGEPVSCEQGSVWCGCAGENASSVSVYEYGGLSYLICC